MGFTPYCRSTRPVAPAEANAVERDANAACGGRTWLSCEPIKFYPGGDNGHLVGGSKPNLQPHPDDAAAAARSSLPDGTTRDLIDILCQLSSKHGVDWQFSHDAGPGSIGYIRSGVCDDDVLVQAEIFAELGDLIAGEMKGNGDEDLA